MSFQPDPCDSFPWGPPLLHSYRLKELAELLPDSNYALLRFLARFLAHIAKRGEVTKMFESNLALVFGPNLLWSR